jgi:uncharacterized membrane protein
MASQLPPALSRVIGTFTPHPHTPRNPHREIEGGYNVQDRIALTITTAIGTMYAVYVFAMFMAAWMLFQVLSGRSAFDPYPFAFLLFLGNIVQLLLMPLIMVGQNLQGRHAEARADEEFRTTQKTFADLETTMAHLDAQDRELLRQTAMLRAIVERLVPPDELAKLEASFGADPLSAPAPAGSAKA